MNSTNLTTIISPRDKTVGVIADGSHRVSIVAPAAHKGSSYRLTDYFDRFPDSTFSNANAADATKQLMVHEDHCFSLDFTLLLFDNDIENETRIDVARELDELLKDDACERYVLDIILASPLRDAANFDLAKSSASSYPRTKAIVQTIENCQPRVKRASDAWLQMRSDPMVRKNGIERIRGALVHFGVFRILTTEGRSKTEVEAVKAKILYTPGLRDLCDARILSKFVAEYSTHLPVGISTKTSTGTPSHLDEHVEDEFGYQADEQPSRNRRPHDSGYIKLEQAQSQVEKIASLYVQGNDSTADQYLEQLIRSQTHDTTDHSHVVKSLCNIATKCTDRGRDAIGLKCLLRALEFPRGIDTVLYLKIGTALRDLNDFDSALSCYEKAKRLDYGEYRDQIRLETIRVWSTRGRYDVALKLYDEIPDIRAHVPTLCARGTLHRWIGDLTAARADYFDVLKLQPSYHTARAGLAESNKLTGRYDKAIKRYERMFHDFPNLDPRSWKIYSLSLAYLFRVEHRFDRSKAILLDVYSRFKTDVDVNTQLGKFYAIIGDARRAAFHFENANDNSLHTAASALYWSAIGSQTFVTQSSSAKTVATPEERGLESCSMAIMAMADGNYDNVIDVLNSQPIVDRLQRDLVAVLTYHVRKRSEPNFNYKSSPMLCRIAKRGYCELRKSVLALSSGDFMSALDFERRTGMQIA